MKEYNKNSDNKQDEDSFLTIAVGILLMSCACALIIAGTIAIIKWMLGF